MFLRDDVSVSNSETACSDYVFRLLLKAASETQEVVKTLIGDDQGTDELGSGHGQQEGMGVS